MTAREPEDLPPANDGVDGASRSPDAPPPCWYVVLTASNREAEAAYKLKRQGYVVFFPRRWHTWSRDGRTTSELRPWLSRYIFAAVNDEHQSVGAINDTDGVSRVLTCAGEAYVVPAATLWDLRAMFDPDGVEPPGVRTSKHIRKMMRGIKGEVAAELMAALERLDDTGRYRLQRGRAGAPGGRVSLPLLQRKAAETDLARGAAA